MIIAGVVYLICPHILFIQQSFLTAT